MIIIVLNNSSGVFVPGQQKVISAEGSKGMRVEREFYVSLRGCLHIKPCVLGYGLSNLFL